MKSLLAAAVVLALAAGPAAAQLARSTPGQPEARTLLELTPARGRLTVTSPAFKDGGDIPFANTQYRGNTFPGLAWSPGPKATRTYAIVMQDTSLLYKGAPILHWTMFNIPASVTRLEAGMSVPPPGAAYGPNYLGAARPYTGPKTPPGPKDAYHFQVFALDAVVPPEAGSSFAVLTKAMEGHVLAAGELVGLGEKDPEAK